MKLPKYFVNNPNRLKRNKICVLCGISEVKAGKKLGKHHLMPKTENTLRGFERVVMCKHCHKCLHGLFDNKTLRRYGKFRALPIKIVEMSLEEAKKLIKNSKGKVYI